MKVFVVSFLCAVLSGASCSVVGWPGATPLSGSYISNVIPSQVKAFGYSTSQYISSVPSSYSFGYQPQIAQLGYQHYQVPVSHYYPQQTFGPIVQPAYYPSTSVFYPTLTPVAPISPIAPVQRPQIDIPSYPAQAQGDEDTTIVDSAEFPAQQQQAQQEPSSGYFPPQNTPQAQAPYIPNEPSPSPPESAPSAGNSDQGLNDEDTVSIESA